MEIVVTGRHTQVKQRFRDVVETKMNRVTAIAPDAQRAQIVLTHEGNPRQADTAKRVEITVIAGRTVVRAEASSTDEFSALDMALDKLTLRLRRTRDRRKDHRRGYANPVPVDLGVIAPEPEPEVSEEEPNNSPQAAVASDLGPGESVEVQVGDTPIVIQAAHRRAYEHRRGAVRDGTDRTRFLPVREQGDRTPVRRLSPSRLELRRVRNRHSGECQESLRVRAADMIS
jgi:ribosomal subunit interface protein